MVERFRRSLLSVMRLVGVLALFGVIPIGGEAEARFLRDGIRPQTGGTPGFKRAPAPGRVLGIRPPGAPKDAVTPRRLGRAPASPQAAHHGWFWEEHSPSLSSAAPERIAAALASIERRNAGHKLIPPKRIQHIATIWGAQISHAARMADLSEALLLAVIAVESAGRADAQSPKGAQGLMQLLPVTARRFGVEDAFEPGSNVNGGAAYLDRLLRDFRGDILLALAAYNAGEGAVRKHGGVPPYAETRDYVVLVLDAMASAASLCANPLSGPRDRCELLSDL